MLWQLSFQQQVTEEQPRLSIQHFKVQRKISGIYLSLEHQSIKLYGHEDRISNENFNWDYQVESQRSEWLQPAEESAISVHTVHLCSWLLGSRREVY